MSTYDFEPYPDDYGPEPPHIANPSKSKPAQPDCRTCDNEHICEDDFTVFNCTNGDQYEPAAKVVLWRTE